MAKNVINEKGFKIVSLSPNECKTIGFGFQYVDKHKNSNSYCWDLICDNCNKLITEHEEVYYIPVLNRVFCQQCLINWYDSATYYTEDKRYEDNKYEMLIANLKANNIVIKEHTKKIL